MGIKSKNHSLGRAIIKDKFKGRTSRPNSFRHTTDLDDGLNWNRINLKSVTEESTLDEFLASAELAGSEFTAERVNVSLVSENNCLPTQEDLYRTKKCQEENIKLLKIPRRPNWTASTTAEELDSMERHSFLEWRRSLAMLSEKEGLMLTPYEKNLEFWRQLWRVIEKSDVVVQIVDARNPLFFYCQDLNAYVNEVDEDKVNLLLVNKADFLTLEQRIYWSNYFTSVGIKIIFWSATNQTDDLLLKHSHHQSDESGTDTEGDSDGENIKNYKNDNIRKNDENIDDVQVKNLKKGNDVKDEEEKKNVKEVLQFVNKANIVSVEELIAIFRTFNKSEKPLFTVGLIGYPNVGKSSTINMLLTKRVALNDQAEKSKMYQTSVSTTPGKTKHFQTFFLDKDLMLCDCPGLVMPMFVNAKAEMITNGILSIDNMNDFVPPITIVCRCIPKDVLEAFYSIMLPVPSEGENPERPPTAYELLSAYARIRGFMTHKGVPDYQRAARVILKDFVHGRLNYCSAPPNVANDEYGCTPSLAFVNKLKNKPDQGSVNLNTTVRHAPKLELDEEFFKKASVGFVIKGDLSNIGLKHLNHSENMAKSSKKHFKSNKREKSRRTNSHLDA